MPSGKDIWEEKLNFDSNQATIAEELNILKAKVKAEMLRRKYRGSLVKYGSEEYDYSVVPEAGQLPLVEQINKIVEPMNAIYPTGHDADVSSGSLMQSIKDLDDKINKSHAIPTRGTSDCAVSCSGLCSSSCADACTSCGGSCSNSCTGGCDTGCKNGCKNGCGTTCDKGCSECTTNCGTSCKKNCTSCTGSCDGGCKGKCGERCEQGCATNCITSCTGACKNMCSGRCVSSCVSDCSGNINVNH